MRIDRDNRGKVTYVFQTVHNLTPVELATALANYGRGCLQRGEPLPTLSRPEVAEIIGLALSVDGRGAIYGHDIGLGMPDSKVSDWASRTVTRVTNH